MPLSEAEHHWRSFLQSLVVRGIRAVKIVVTDDHGRLKAARQAVLTGVLSQPCQFHFMRNAMVHAPKVAMRPDIAPSIRRLLEADEPAKAERRFREMVTH